MWKRSEKPLIKQNLYEDTIKLELGSELDDVSSSKIRENLDPGRDISNLIDPLCQRFIYEYGIYLREPQYKELQLTKAFVAEAEPLGEKLSEKQYLFFGNAGVFAYRSGAEQLISSLHFNKGFALPAHAIRMLTANDPGEILSCKNIEKEAAVYAERIKKNLYTFNKN